MVSLRIQENLRSLPLERAPWYVSLPLASEDNELLGTFARLELLKDNPTGDQTQLRYDLAGLRAAAWRISKPKLGHIFAVVMGSPEQKSRVRSYKGLFWETPIKPEEFRQREITLGEQTFFLGVVKVSLASKEWSFRKALRRFHAFLYIALEDDIDTIAEKTFSLLPKVINCNVISYFELPRLVSAFVGSDEAIFHLDCDFSGERWSELYIYTKLASVPYWEQAVRAQMEDLEWPSLFALRTPEDEATKSSRPDHDSNYGRVYWPK